MVTWRLGASDAGGQIRANADMFDPGRAEHPARSASHDGHARVGEDGLVRFTDSARPTATCADVDVHRPKLPEPSNPDHRRGHRSCVPPRG